MHNSSPATCRTLRVSLAQLPVAVGDLTGNADRIRAAMRTANAAGAELLLTPEMAVTGYPVEDLLSSPAFLTATEQVVSELVGEAGSTVTVLGAPMRDVALPAAGGATSEHSNLDAAARTLRNTAVLAVDGELVAAHAKTLLPTYSVFDDSRHFAPGPRRAPLYRIGGVLVAILVCEDLWSDELADDAAADGAQLLAVINASPYHVGKPQIRRELITRTAARTGTAVCYVNCVGGQDEVVFDGNSLIAGPDGTLLACGASFEADVLTVDVPVGPARHTDRQVLSLSGPGPGRRPALPTRAVPEAAPGAAGSGVEAEVYTAAVTGLRDYFARTGFTRAILGLSGGIDSALVAAMAVDALGPQNVWGIGMPGPYSSPGSVTDARELADNLGITFDVIDIAGGYHERLAALGDTLLDGGHEPFGAGVARENLQARLRGATLMTLANAHGALLLTTGNKSESAVGFFTIYGDSCGGVNPLGDIPKTDVTYRDGTRMPGVFTLSRWRNSEAIRRGDIAPIPVSTLTKPPSAELAEDQQDSDSLPPYEILDPLLCAFLEEHAHPDTLVDSLVDKGYPLEQAHAVVTRVLRLIEISEWKRRQVPFRIKLTRLAFGRDRRMPLANNWRFAPTPLDQPDPSAGSALPERAIEDVLPAAAEPALA